MKAFLANASQEEVPQNSDELADMNTCMDRICQCLSHDLHSLVSLVKAGICSFFIGNEDDDVHEQLPCLMLSGLVMSLSGAVPQNKH